DTQREHYSGKKKKHTLQWQIVVLPNGFIIGLYGAFVGKENDKGMYNSTNLREKFLNKPYAIGADGGYPGLKEVKKQRKPPNLPRPPPVVLVNAYIPYKKKKQSTEPLTVQQREWNREFSSLRVVVENTIAQIKEWKVVRGPMRFYKTGDK